MPVSSGTTWRCFLPEMTYPTPMELKRTDTMKVVPISIWSLPWGRGSDSPPRGPLEPRGSMRAHVEGSMSVAAFPHRGQGFPALAHLHPASVSMTVGHLSGQAGASVVALQHLSRPRPSGCCARLDRTCCTPPVGHCLAGNT